MSDFFSGYRKCVSDTNKHRTEMGLPLIRNIYCNAHARRKFLEAQEKYPEESQLFIELYQKIYFLESQTKSKPPDEPRELRGQMRPLFQKMAQRAIEVSASCSTKRSLFKTLRYFLDNLQNLTAFIDRADASALLYSLVVTAKSNNVNPYKAMVKILTEIPKVTEAEGYEALARTILQPE